MRPYKKIREEVATPPFEGRVTINTSGGFSPGKSLYEDGYVVKLIALC